MEIRLVMSLLRPGLRRAEVSRATHQKDAKLGRMGLSWNSEQFPPWYNSRKKEACPLS